MRKLTETRRTVGPHRPNTLSDSATTRKKLRVGCTSCTLGFPEKMRGICTNSACQQLSYIQACYSVCRHRNHCQVGWEERYKRDKRPDASASSTPTSTALPPSAPPSRSHRRSHEVDDQDPAAEGLPGPLRAAPAARRALTRADRRGRRRDRRRRQGEDRRRAGPRRRRHEAHLRRCVRCVRVRARAGLMGRQARSCPTASRSSRARSRRRISSCSWSRRSAFYALFTRAVR
jgi:hypothetical protein